MNIRDYVWNKTEQSKKQKLWEVIHAFCQIIDALTVICTLGNYGTKLSVWSIFKKLKNI